MITLNRQIQYLLIRVLWSLVPGEKLKQRLRLLFLQSRPVLPRELMVNRGDSIVQVGIPSKNSLYRLIKSIGKSGSLLIVEPDERNQEMIVEVIGSLDASHNVRLVKKAAWHSTEELVFHKSKRLGDGRIADKKILHDNDIREQNESGGYTEIILNADRLDNILLENKVDQLDFIEIAINGAEFHALRGMGELVKKTKRLYIKGHARDAESDEPILFQIIDYLEGYDFFVKRTIATRAVDSRWGDREGDVYAWKI